MKIISKTKGGVLVDMSITELIQIVGNRSLLNYGCFENSKLGTVIPVSDIFEQSARLHKLPDEVLTLQLKLRSLADSIEPIKIMTEAVSG